MKHKCFLMTSLVVFLINVIYGYVMHHMLMATDYESVSFLWREKMHFAYIYGGYAVFSLAFVYMYGKGHEAKKSWLHQGASYGLLVWLLTFVPSSLIGYAIHPITHMMMVKSMLLYLVLTMLMGLATARMQCKGK